MGLRTVNRGALRPRVGAREGISQKHRPTQTLGERRWAAEPRSEEHTSELQSLTNLVCRLLLEKKKKTRRATCCTKITASSSRWTTRCTAGRGTWALWITYLSTCSARSHPSSRRQSGRRRAPI